MLAGSNIKKTYNNHNEDMGVVSHNNRSGKENPI